MANAYLSDYQFINNAMSNSADLALDKFYHSKINNRSAQNKAQEQAEAQTDSLSYLFSIFAY